MPTNSQVAFKRELLNTDNNQTTTATLQDNLVNLVDLALLLKQAHWNVVGTNFRSLHLQLDAIIETVRGGSDDIAERIATLGIAADGRSQTVARNSHLHEYPEGMLTVEETVQHVADELHATVTELRNAIQRLGELDPISEDLCIGICASLEKHLWMLQAQEKSN